MLAPKIVSVHSRQQVAEMEPDKEKCLVSVSTPGKDYIFHPELSGWRAVLELAFDDVSTLSAGSFLGPSVIRFHREQAQELLAFLQKHFDEDFVVHCDLGVSRSLAIGCFIRDHLGHELEKHGGQDEDDMNKWVYKVLHKHWTRYFMVRPKT